MEDFAEIRSASSFYKIKPEFLKFKEQGFTLEHYYFVDTSVFTIFPIVLVSGNPKEILASTNSIVITQSIAKKYSGSLPVLLIADTLKLFGQGTKVAVEISVMAADSGALLMRALARKA